MLSESPFYKNKNVGGNKTIRNDSKLLEFEILRITKYMERHLDQHLPVSVLAAEVGKSVSHFFKLFREQTGYAPINYWNHLRVQHACILLTTTAMRVKEISIRFGYRDYLYFSRVFKLSMGVSPSTYRLATKKSFRAAIPVS